MIPVVFDANAVVSGCCWRREANRCLSMVARRRLKSFATQPMNFEWRETIANLAARFAAKGKRFERDPWPTLNWLIEHSEVIEPAALGKQRSRDFMDDCYLACALAAGARYIVSSDHDLLELEKPFGIEIVQPRELLSILIRNP